MLVLSLGLMIKLYPQSNGENQKLAAAEKVSFSAQLTSRRATHSQLGQSQISNPVL